MNNNYLYTKEEIQSLAPFFKTKGGSFLFSLLEKITKLDKVNEAYHKSCEREGIDCVEELLKNFKVKYKIGGLPLDKLPDGPFVIISNHPYGGIDGLIILDIFGHRRPKMKVMVNKILGRAQRIGDNLITVTPTGENREEASAESIKGVKECISQIRNGEVLSIFPSGAVSDLKPSEGWTVSDRDWQLPAIRLIQKLNVPVVPVRFFDRNSNFYYLLGLLSWKIRLLRLPREILNKKGKQIRVGIGEIVEPSELKNFDNLESLRDFLRSKVYDMPLPKHFD